MIEANPTAPLPHDDALRARIVANLAAHQRRAVADDDRKRAAVAIVAVECDGVASFLLCRRESHAIHAAGAAVPAPGFGGGPLPGYRSELASLRRAASDATPPGEYARVIEAARQLGLRRTLPSPYSRRVRVEVLLARSQMPFFARLTRDSLFEGFVRYLAVRIADQQQVIANLVTVDSEQRLGQTLLQLARTMGKKDPRSIRIELERRVAGAVAELRPPRPQVLGGEQRILGDLVSGLGAIVYNLTTSAGTMALIDSMLQSVTSQPSSGLRGTTGSSWARSRSASWWSISSLAPLRPMPSRGCAFLTKISSSWC